MAHQNGNYYPKETDRNVAEVSNNSKGWIERISLFLFSYRYTLPVGTAGIPLTMAMLAVTPSNQIGQRIICSKIKREEK